MKPLVVAPVSETQVFDDAEALARHAAEWLCALAERSSGSFAVSLSGGSTPRRLYQLLANADLPWERVHWFWGDERYVPHDDAQSNYRMACEALLGRAPVPAANVHPMPTAGLSPEEAAAAYEAVLQRFYGARTLARERPLFDAMLLGIGEDGHTASLFPGQPALEEERRWVVAVRGAKKEARITLTYPALQSSRHTAFLATGAAKRDAVRRAQAGDRALPAGRLRPVGARHWFIDRAAAGK
jgi:6-phosphogluconolactonase